MEDISQNSCQKIHTTYITIVVNPLKGCFN